MISFIFIDCEDGDIRLTGSSKREQEGTVEICLDNLWGMIADSGWGQVDANVVCSQLGYDTTGSYYYCISSNTLAYLFNVLEF